MKKPNKLLNNIGLKITAVAFSVLLWLVVININNPVGEKTFRDLKIELKNTTALTDEGKTYEVLDSTDRVSVTVRASRSVLDSISASDITATADFSELSFTNTVPIRLSVSRYLDNQIQEISGSIDIMKLEVEDLIERQLVIQTVQTGTPAASYMVSKVAITDGNAMKISGPESLISQVNRAVVEADVAGLTDSITITEKIRLLDAEGNEITDSKIIRSVNTAKVSITILQTKEVPLTLSTQGEPAAGYAFTGEITSAPETVTIAGRSSAVSAVEEIVIPSEELDLTGATADVTKLVDVNEYLPDGVMLTNTSDEEFNGKAAVTAKIEPLIQITRQLDAAQIQITNVPEGYQVTLNTEEDVSIRMQGLQDYLNQVDAAALTGIIDVTAWMAENSISELKEGTETMTVSVALPAGVTQTAAVRASVHITINANTAD